MICTYRKKMNPEYHSEIIIHNCNEYYRTTEIFLFTPGSVLNCLLPWNKTFLCIATKTSRATGGLSELSLPPSYFLQCVPREPRLAPTPGLHFCEAESGRGQDIQMSRSDSSSFPQCSACLKVHWLLLLSQLLTSQRCALKTSDARGSRRTPHCLYEGTLTDLSGGFFFSPVRGLWREAFYYCHLLMSPRAADY